MDEENNATKENNGAPASQPEADIKDLIKKNLELTEEILKMTKKIRSFVFWERIFRIVKLVIIVIPLVLGIIYLPALLDNVIRPYQELLNVGQQASNDLNNIDLNTVRNLLK